MVNISPSIYLKDFKEEDERKNIIHIYWYSGYLKEWPKWIVYMIIYIYSLGILPYRLLSRVIRCGLIFKFENLQGDTYWTLNYNDNVKTNEDYISIQRDVPQNIEQYNYLGFINTSPKNLLNEIRLCIETLKSNFTITNFWDLFNILFKHIKHHIDEFYWYGNKTLGSKFYYSNGKLKYRKTRRDRTSKRTRNNYQRETDRVTDTNVDFKFTEHSSIANELSIAETKMGSEKFNIARDVRIYLVSNLSEENIFIETGVLFEFYEEDNIVLRYILGDIVSATSNEQSMFYTRKGLIDKSQICYFSIKKSPKYFTYWYLLMKQWFYMAKQKNSDDMSNFDKEFNDAFFKSLCKISIMSTPQPEDGIPVMFLSNFLTFIVFLICLILSSFLYNFL